MKITKEELERLEANTREFLQLMKQGNFSEARSIATLLEHYTYTLDATWMKAYEARQRVKA